MSVVPVYDDVEIYLSTDHRRLSSPGSLKVKAVDVVSRLCLMSQISETNEEDWVSLRETRNVVLEYKKLFNIYNKIAEMDGSKIISEVKFYDKLHNEEYLLGGTPFSGFVIFDESRELLGRLGIKRCDPQDSVDLAAVRDASSAYSIRADEIYISGKNENQLEVLLLPEYYDNLYGLVISLGRTFVKSLIKKNFLKLINRCLGNYSDGNLDRVDRWIITSIDVDKLKLGKIPYANIDHLESIQGQLLILEEQNILKNRGYLLPQSVDPRNDRESICRVYELVDMHTAFG